MDLIFKAKSAGVTLVGSWVDENIFQEKESEKLKSRPYQLIDKFYVSIIFFYYYFSQSIVNLWVIGIYGDLFSPIKFICNEK